MQIEFGDNNTITNVQFGDHNKLCINNDVGEVLVPEEYWRELQQILGALVDEDRLHGNQQKVAKDALKYAEKRDGKGFLGILKRNKETFFTNILSDVASSGLILFLKKLCI